MSEADPVVSLGALDLEHWTRGALYAAGQAPLGQRLGLTDLGARYCEVPPGKSACPFHNHHVEDELFVILEGEGTYRFGSARHAVKAGDVLGAPAGDQRTAHHLINTGTGVLRYLAISSVGRTDICEYPDSGKILVSSQPRPTMPDGFDLMQQEGANVPYWTGEAGADEDGPDKD
ncbi:cupin domain-containing protein [Mangrovibrevibacter kandeliae]|uniref:cupin domain-containing protein n=1 Tax=Mangrovibrevibacter kandeliae TaxID=2968473 RepID=UPI002117A26C|nr:cupin domain-containing protein [Aurantimonas sp. CSK15Z-1]MCQ8781152.1 cupin domain-containing protein [Aurantimonas sp. CSK15Z-1]